MTSIEEYFTSATKEQRAEYERIKSIAIKLVPEYEETISYGLPTIKYKTKPLIYFGAFKNHMSIFPTPSPVEEIKERLQDYKVSKGTIQFTHANPLSDDVIKDLVLLRKQSIDGNN